MCGRLAAMTAVLVACVLTAAMAADRTAAYAVIRVQSLPAQVMFFRYASLADCRRELPQLKLLATAEFQVPRISGRDVIAPDDLPGNASAPARVEGVCRVLPNA
jgi:hypothetical protein